MKKTLLSMLAGIAVVGSAFAVPSPDDRRALCEQHPDKYVWVEKTQACIPVLPCLSDNISIVNAYCANVGSFVDEGVMRAVHNKYIEQILHTHALSSSYHDNGGDRGGYYSYKLADGGYISIYVLTGDNPFDDENNPDKNLVLAVCGAYNPSEVFDAGSGVLLRDSVEVNERYNGFACPGIKSAELCDDMTQFISSLGSGEFEGKWDSAQECVLQRKK